MPIATSPLYLPAGITNDQNLAAFLRSMINRIDKPRVEAVADIPGASTTAELKMNELLAALRTAAILEE